MLSTLLHHRRGRSLPLENGRPANDILSSSCSSGDLSLDYSAPKRSGPHNLTRNGYDEEKCRNVLVRYCAHIPRNYQYKDGIKQIFLILREHLGDENLDLAGGVLYELIEVDCEHTDDPGAAFQRWRYNHMRRYSDLELPHVPHLTTVTSSIIPTEKLENWRSKHPDRYTFLLSDSTPSTQRLSNDPSCIRNRKAWLIDHTFYVSSRTDGTRPINSPNPKEFHEMQWNSEFGAQGRLVEERDVTFLAPDRPSGTSPPRTADTLLTVSSHSETRRHSLSRLSIFDKLISRLRAPKREPEVEQKRRSWMPSAFMFETASLFREKRSGLDSAPVPLPDDCEIPNAIFARKNLLVDTGDSLPPYLSISHMPTAEAKATETIVEAATTGLLGEAPPWSFRGPFTPQLGFDGGLDYQWSSCEPMIIRRRFDINASNNGNAGLQFGIPSRGSGSRANERSPTQPGSAWKRRGMIFSSEGTMEWNDSIGMLSEDCEFLGGTPDDLRDAEQRDSGETIRISPPVHEPLTPSTQCNMISQNPNRAEASSEERQCLKQRDSIPVDSMGVATPPKTPEKVTPTSNRKATVVELSSHTIEYVPLTPDANHVERIWLAPNSFTSLRDFSSSSISPEMFDGSIGECSEFNGEPQLATTICDVPPDCDAQLDGPRLCGASQGVTIERLQESKYSGGVAWKEHAR
ncbi:hypothetical protein F5B20DRAFT_584175 [Whalleya microplaca]|nr:hypothetical protein F5B20DRAFT_584175 [Whalleya microplaca]